MGLLMHCEHCGKAMVTDKSRKDRTRFCSKDCMNAALRGVRRSPETEFKGGNRPHTWVPVGTESDATKGGYIKVKVAEPNVWRLRSHLVWEETNGRRLPDGWIVRHLDGDPENDDPQNLKAMPRSRHLQKTLEDPKILAKKKRKASEATKKRWREKRMERLDTYYWQ